jgi:iron complex outermembrane receptor protein
MKNQLFIILALLLSTSFSFSQNGSIKGTTIDNTQRVVSGVNIFIKNSTQGVESDKNGVFEITNIADGNHILVVSYLGFKTKEIPFTISNNETKQFGAIILYEGNELLREVVLYARNNKFSRKETAYVAKLPLKDIENSHVYSTITSELLESEIVTNLDDALSNATGVSKLWEATGRAPGNGTGWFATRGFATQPKLVDGLPGFTFSAIDPSYIERIEVIKGPSATLFGSTETSLGGLINVVTKKPYQGFGGTVSYTGGNFNTHRGSVDVNTPIGRSEKLFFRINTSYLTQDSFQDAGFRETFFVAPSISYRVNNRLNLSLGLEYSRTRQTNPSMLFLRRGLPMVSRNVEQLGVDPKKSFTSDDVFLTSPILNARAIADYKISDKWTSQTVIASNFSEAKGYYQYNIDGGAVAILQLSDLANNPDLGPIVSPFINPMLVEANELLQRDLFTRIFDKRDANATNFNIQQNFIGDFKIGELRNRVVIGLDYLNKSQHSKNRIGNPVITSTSNFPQLLGFLSNPPSPPIPDALIPTLQGVGQQLNTSYSALPYFDAFIDARGNVAQTTITPNAGYSPTRAQLDAIFGQVPVRNLETSSQIFATYISNVINIKPNLTVNVGLRLDYFDQEGNKNIAEDNYTKTTFSPNAGIVYQPILNKLSLFGNYQTGFINVDPIINGDGTITTLQPQKANQFEGGVKTNLFNGKLNLGVSYYYIIVKDRAISDPRIPLLPQTIDIEKTVSKGIEFEVNSSPISGLSLRASYAYNDSKLTDTYSKIAQADIVSIKDRRPEEAGPESTYNFWADYKFSVENFLNNFGVGIGFNGASEHLALNNAISGEFTLPGYTVFNASLYYDANNYRVGIKVNNFTDETYYRGWGTVNAQAPRAFLANLTYKF